MYQGSSAWPAKGCGRRGAVLFAAGFRPFFLAAALYAAFALPLWLATFSGRLDPALAVAPSLWHAHEMLFGYLAAVVAGFLLTAVPNWTGRLPISGLPLAGLFLLWLLGRVAQGPELARGPVSPLLDVLFLVVLTAVIGREIWAGRNLRNLPVCLLVGGLYQGALIMTHLMARGGPPAALRSAYGTAHRCAKRAWRADKQTRSNESLSTLLGISGRQHRIPSLRRGRRRFSARRGRRRSPADRPGRRPGGPELHPELAGQAR